MSFKHKQIINLFTDPKETMSGGLWFSGEEGEGEFRTWYKSGRLETKSFYKDNELEGEYRDWHENGKLEAYGIYKKGQRTGEFKMWNEDGSLRVHKLYNDNGVFLKDYLK